MNYREIGRTGMVVSELSFGCSSLGGVFRSIKEQDAIEAVFTAIECGINFLDVSPYYVYDERHIELVFEEHRYFDLRRWMIASEVLNRPGHGIKITLDKATGVKTYEDELLLDRKFNDSMYLLPIATDELLKNNGTLQQTRTWR